jgi:predicted RNA binding protein YcfA (HicA-like mRNA interferase family)
MREGFVLDRLKGSHRQFNPSELPGVDTVNDVTHR